MPNDDYKLAWDRRLILMILKLISKDIENIISQTIACIIDESKNYNKIMINFFCHPVNDVWTGYSSLGYWC